jgi:hypothetical protein
MRLCVERAVSAGVGAYCNTPYDTSGLDEMIDIYFPSLSLGMLWMQPQ